MPEIVDLEDESQDEIQEEPQTVTEQESPTASEIAEERFVNFS